MPNKYYSVEVAIEHLFDIHYSDIRPNQFSKQYAMNTALEKIIDKSKHLHCQYAINKAFTKVCVLFLDPKEAIEFYVICNRVLGRWKAELKVISIELKDYIQEEIKF